jgi:hypothetical protein
LHNLAEESKSLFWIVKKTSSFWIVKAISAQAILHTFKFTLPFENDFFHFTKIDERKRDIDGEIEKSNERKPETLQIK